MKKKVISLVLIAAMAISMVACGKSDSKKSDSADAVKELKVQVGPNPETFGSGIEQCC